jgi:CRISPR-associated protein Csx17
MMEGSVTFSAAATRRLDTQRPARAAAPFAMAGRAAGYATASDEDESARGEQWMPLWSQPSTYRELKHLFSEGRAQLDRKRVSGSLDFTRAAARLGTARGIVAFQRYSYIERNGQSQLAVPIGRYFVAEQSTEVLSALDDLDVCLSLLQMDARSKGASAQLELAGRTLANALFSVVQRADEHVRWQEVLLRLADVEEIQISGTGFRAGPIPRLRPQWITNANDSSPEFRLALAFALQNAGPRPEDRALGGVRRHWIPLNGSRYAVSGQGSQGRLLIGPDQVMRGRSGLDDAIALVNRRLIEAAQSGQRRLPLQAARGFASSASDIGAFIAGEVDADRSVHLARALMAVDARSLRHEHRFPTAPKGDMPHDAWMAIRLSMLPWALEDGRRIGADPAVLRRLVAGDSATAVELARLRLAAAGIRTTFRAASVPPLTAKRWAAALAFPISKSTATQFVRLLDPSQS